MLIPTGVSSAPVQHLLDLKEHASSIEKQSDAPAAAAASFGISDLFTSRLQTICLQSNMSQMWHNNTEAPKGPALSCLLFTL